MGPDSARSGIYTDVRRLLQLTTSNRSTSSGAEPGELRRSGSCRNLRLRSGNLPAAMRMLALGTWLFLGLSTMASAGGCCAGESGVAEPGASAPSNYLAGVSTATALPEWLFRSSLPMPAEYTIRHVVPEVRVEFSVIDKAGRPAPEVSPADVEVFEDEIPVERFMISVRPDQLPLTLEIMLDASDSFRKTLPTERDPVSQLVRAVQHSGRDLTFLTALDQETRTWTAGDEQLASLFDWTEHRSGHSSGTILYDALYSACRNHMDFNQGGEPRRHLLVVVSDGLDTQSLHQLSDVIQIAQQTETRVFTVTSHRGRTPLVGDWPLQRIAEETGGQAFVAHSGRELVEALAQIEREAAVQYLLTFRPVDNAPGFHSLRIKLRAFREARIQARQAYYTPGD